MILVSIKIGFKFKNKTTSATDSHEKLGIMISSPFFKLSDNNDIKSASVPDPTVQTYFEPVNLDNLFSNFSTFSPNIKLFSLTVFKN